MKTWSSGPVRKIRLCRKPLRRSQETGVGIQDGKGFRQSGEGSRRDNIILSFEKAC
jgi:hypothetical protein